MVLIEKKGKKEDSNFATQARKRIHFLNRLYFSIFLFIQKIFLDFRKKKEKEKNRKIM